MHVAAGSRSSSRGQGGARGRKIKGKKEEKPTIVGQVGCCLSRLLLFYFISIYIITSLVSSWLPWMPSRSPLRRPQAARLAAPVWFGGCVCVREASGHCLSIHIITPSAFTRPSRSWSDVASIAARICAASCPPGVDVTEKVTDCLAPEFRQIPHKERLVHPLGVGVVGGLVRVPEDVPA